MPVSQNLRFQAKEELEFAILPGNDYEHFRGETLLKKLSAQLAERSWNMSEIEYWRDCGWSVDCRRESSELEVILSPILDMKFHREWMLQIAPKRVPFIGRLFGWQPSATPDNVYQLALDVHATLAKDGSFRTPLWRWDGPPDDKSSTPEPQPPK